MGLDDRFNEYFRALDRSGGEDCCYICRRTPAEVKVFFGFDEDGTPFDAEELGLEDVALDHQDVMSYRGLRPVCAVCQLNIDAIIASGEGQLLRNVLTEMIEKRDKLWPADEP